METQNSPYEFLIGKFGHCPFEVADLSADDVAEFRKLLGIPKAADGVMRRHIGRWLAAHPSLVTTLKHSTSGNAGKYLMNQPSESTA